MHMHVYKSRGHNLWYLGCQPGWLTSISNFWTFTYLETWIVNLFLQNLLFPSLCFNQKGHILALSFPSPSFYRLNSLLSPLDSTWFVCVYYSLLWCHHHNFIHHYLLPGWPQRPPNKFPCIPSISPLVFFRTYANITFSKHNVDHVTFQYKTLFELEICTNQNISPIVFWLISKIFNVYLIRLLKNHKLP